MRHYWGVQATRVGTAITNTRFNKGMSTINAYCAVEGRGRSVTSWYIALVFRIAGAGTLLATLVDARGAMRESTDSQHCSEFQTRYLDHM